MSKLSIYRFVVILSAFGELQLKVVDAMKQLGLFDNKMVAGQQLKSAVEESRINQT